MSASTFMMSVPVDMLYVTNGPGLKRLEKIEYAYSPDDAIAVKLTLKTGASNRTLVRTVRAWEYRPGRGFRLLLSGWVRWCDYDTISRTGEIDIEHPDDKFRREIQEDLEDSAAEIARF